MRILMLTPAYPPFPGGGERYAGSLAAELVRQGHEVTAVTTTATTEKAFWQGTPTRKPIHENLDGVQVLRCPVRPFPGKRPGLMGWRKLMVLLSMLPGDQTAVLQKMARLIPPIHNLETALAQLPGRFDLVHGFNLSWEYSLLAGWRFARQQGLPFVITPFAHLGTGNDRVARNSTMDHQLHLLRDAERVLVLTSVEQEDLDARGISRLAVISGGLDPLPPLANTAVLNTSYCLPRPYVIFIGRASYDKGAIHAAEAVLALQAAGNAVTLALIGQSSPEFDRFYRRLDEKERERIRPLGILSDSDKHGLLAKAAVLLLPSRTDSFGIVLLEAWAHGVPIIAARAGGIPGVVDDSQNGLLVEFGNVPALSQAIQQLLADEALRRRLGEYGRTKTETTYTWTAVAERVVANYKAIRKPITDNQ